MAEIDLNILFKQTTGNFIRCKICSSSVKGKDGYIKINLYSWEEEYVRNIDKRIVVCNTCFKKWTDKIKVAKENKEELYSKLIKTKILDSLK